MRILKRGTRGNDVALWQQFLMVLGSRATAVFSPPAIRVDGIFGRETARATLSFQQRYMLRVDGIVGRQTFDMAKQLGLGRPGDTLGLGPVFGPLAYREMAEPPPLIARPAPGPAPPAPGAGNSREKTWARLRAEGWKSLGAVQSGLNGGGAVLQLLANGDGAYIYDEYAVEIEQMPSGKTPEAFLTDMATDLNGTVADQEFNGVNVFIRRPPGASSPPKIGDIIDIDIEGPDNGSVILVESEPTYFVFQTVESDKMGSHPENGSREFGFEREPSGKVRFYTRGVSRPGNWLVRKFGAGPQRKGWTRLMKGISAKIVSLGGKSNPGTFSEHKHESPE